jgi:hypothetical protein
MAHPEAKPEIFILGGDVLNRPVWKYELERLDVINRKSILVRLPRIAFFSRASSINQKKIEGRTRTAAKRKASNADARYATTNNVQTGPVKCFVHIVPYESRADLDEAGRLINNDLIESGHGDLHSRRRRETRVGGVATTLYGKGRARRTDNA